MAKLKKLPEDWRISAWKGILDFYYWKGIAVARKWPHHPKRKPTQLEAAHQQRFGYASHLYSQLPLSVLIPLSEMAASTSQTPKDYFVKAYTTGIFDIMPPEYYATEETAQAILDQVTDTLKTGDLSIQEVTKYLEVAVKASALPDGAATELRQEQIRNRLYQIMVTRGTLASASRENTLPGDYAWHTMLTWTGKGILTAIDFAADDPTLRMELSIDGEKIRVLAPDGTARLDPEPQHIHALGGETAHYKETLWDDTNNYYAFHLKHPIHFNINILIRFYNGTGADHNCAAIAIYQPVT